jgi:hypothetical protein
MNMISPEQFEQIIPLAVQYVERGEQRILMNGVSLSESLIADARNVPVNSPENVKLLSVSAVPPPTDPLLRLVAETTGIISPETAGLTLRYGIFIRSDCWDRGLIVHELGHVAQYERMGSIEAFLRQYLKECNTIGYPEAPMEQEAIAVAKKICT